MKNIKVFLLIIAANLILVSFVFGKVDTAWVNRYDNPAHDTDYTRAIVVDASGNVYVTGSTKGATGFDFLTIKYNSSGVEQWQRIRDNANDNDYSYAIAVDGSGNVYVTGASYSSATAYDYMTIKYNSMGTRQWEKFYDGPGSGNDEARAIAVDASGDVYVTGFSVGSGVGATYDYATVKYDAAGNQLWVSRYDGPDNQEDKATGLVLRADTAFVTGYSYSLAYGHDYLTVKILPNGDTAWTRRLLTNAGPDYANAIAISSSGNVYVTGQYAYGGGSNITTVRYTSTGTQSVFTTYNGPASYSNSWDVGTAIAVDGSGNTYVAGYSMNASLNYDYITLKYNSSGAITETLRYDAGGEDRATSIVVNNLGYIYVTGYSNGAATGYDFATIKYGASSGQWLWITRYDNSYGPDQANAIAVDTDGNTYVTGGSYTSSTSVDVATIKYGVVRDVGVNLITRPIDIIDSTATITPRVRVINNGSELETFNAIFRIDGWSNTVLISDLPPDSTRFVNFPQWTIGPRGSYATKCSTYGLIGDAVFTNDTISGAFSVRVRDIGTDLIIQPSGDIDSTALIIPQAKIKNYGTTAETFNIKFTISNGTDNYSDDSIISLNAGDSLVIDFTPWAVITDTFLAKCSTEFTDDIKRDNDKKERSFRVIVHNVGVMEIIAPDGNTDSIGMISPEVRIINQGTETETFNVWFFIPEAGYTNMKTVTIGPQLNSVIVFDPWIVGPRGTYTTRCSTGLINDMIAINDTLIRSFNVIVHNVGVTEILQPGGTIDSTGQVTPRARIKNFGTEPENFNVKFSILGPTNWSDDEIISLSSGQELIVDFASWTTRRGIYTTKCSTELNNDMISSDDKTSSSVEVRVRDYAVSAITSPVGEIDSGATITPRAWIHNYGTTNEISIPVVFYIANSSYTSTKYVSLNAGESVEQVFDSYDVHLPRGIHAMRCTTQLTNDLREDNNFASSNLLIRFYDVAVTEIIRPIGMTDSTANINPQAKVKNYGTRDETFNVTFTIGSWSDSKEVVALPPSEEEIVTFEPWPVSVRGDYTARCSTYMPDDLNPANDTFNCMFTIRVKDYAVSSVYPVDTLIDYGMMITPQAWIHNFGSTDEIDIPVVFYINGTAYSSLRNISLTANDSVLQSFDDFIAEIPAGDYTMCCSTQLNDDLVVANNYATTILSVIVPGWQIRDTIHIAERGINAGASLAAIADTIYALQGNNTNYFFAYYPNADSWVSKCSMPYLYKPDWTKVNRKVKAGGALVNCNNVLYGLKGNNTTEFYAYINSGDSWIRKMSIPEYAPSNLTKKKRVKAGASLVAVGCSLYAFKGGNCEQFWMYDINADTWYEKKSLIADRKKPKAGASLTAIGCTVYAFVGGNSYYFYQYLPSADSWIRMPDAKFGSPRTNKRKIKDGADLTAVEDKLFALKGGNTCDFGYFSTQADTWFTLESIPGPPKVKTGGSLVANNNRLYVFKGGKSYQFWQYTISTGFSTDNIMSSKAISRSNLMSPENRRVFMPSIEVNPNPITKNATIQFTVTNPGAVKINLYNISGAFVETIHNGYYEPGIYDIQYDRVKLAHGIYILKYHEKYNQSTIKLIVE
jgi:uncharacterized delta-60 repeat protein